jgi:hypothetical protein
MDIARDEEIKLALTRVQARLATQKVSVANSARSGNKIGWEDITNSARDVFTSELSPCMAAKTFGAVKGLASQFIVPFSYEYVGKKSSFEDMKIQAGVLGSGAAGAAVGSIFPVVGTTIGMFVGMGIGAFASYSNNKKKQDRQTAEMIEAYFDAVAQSLQTQRDAICLAAKKASGDA